MLPSLFSCFEEGRAISSHALYGGVIKECNPTHHEYCSTERNPLQLVPKLCTWPFPGTKHKPCHHLAWQGGEESACGTFTVTTSSERCALRLKNHWSLLLLRRTEQWGVLCPAGTEGKGQGATGPKVIPVVSGPNLQRDLCESTKRREGDKPTLWMVGMEGGAEGAFCPLCWVHSSCEGRVRKFSWIFPLFS